MAARKALIAGATGVVGRYPRIHLLQAPAPGISSPSRGESPICRAITPHCDGFDRPCGMPGRSGRDRRYQHVFYTAYAERSDSREQVAVNTGMPVNLVEAWRWIALVGTHQSRGGEQVVRQVHIRRRRRKTIPATCRSTFYYDQQDFPEQRQKGSSWSCSALPPHAIRRFSVGNPMNLTPIRNSDARGETVVRG